MDEFAPAFDALWNGQPVKCLSTQRTFDALPRPTLAVLDVRLFAVIFERASSLIV
jgi:hypothetical protein